MRNVGPSALAVSLGLALVWTRSSTATDADATTAAAQASASASAAQSEQKAAEAVKAADEAKTDLDRLRTGKLISLGVTGGVAAAFQLPSFIIHSPTTDQIGTKLTTMPYLLVLPGYWAAPQATREYCGSAWGAGDEDAATAAAIAVARKRAARLFDASLRAVQLIESEKYKQYEESIGVREGTLEYVHKWLVLSKSDYPQSTKDAFKQVVVDYIVDDDWKPGRKGSCASTKWGVWVGYPLKYGVRTLIAGTPDASRDITPTFAFGGAFAPNAYFSILLGFTVGTVTLDATPTTAAEDHTIWATTLAIGGNLDLLGTIFK